MTVSSAALVIPKYAQAHQVIMRFLHKLSDEQLQHRMSPQSHDIAWHAWHLARWADYLQATLPGMAPALARFGADTQLWHTKGWAARWGFPPETLGFHETGMDMSDEVAFQMRFPVKDQLLGYVGAAFTQAEARINTLTDEEFQALEQPQPLTEGLWEEGIVGNAILVHVLHDYRHMGMMEALLGLQGQRGTATR